ncbi:MAG: hypothetical protein CL666_16900 [Balneola sp.]|nr:hypothetical protein [Balneola sp.]|tara:strand:- start:8661 stop:8888 length:228 start_codon:yes stop_codon:yes gene_type:complete
MTGWWGLKWQLLKPVHNLSKGHSRTGGNLILSLANTLFSIPFLNQVMLIPGIWEKHFQGMKPPPAFAGPSGVPSG